MRFGSRGRIDPRKKGGIQAKDPHQPSCMVAHDMINKFSAIIGQCDLQREKVGPSAEYAGWLSVIRNIAAKAVEELREHQRQVSAETQKPDRQKAG